MKKPFTFFINSFLILFFSQPVFGQLSAPDANEVYGGRMNAAASISTGGSTSRIFVATESANSVFYADVTTTSSSENFGTFTVMPGLGNDDGYGSGISILQAHTGSGYLFFIQNNTLYKTVHSGSTVSTVASPSISALTIYGDYIFYIEGSTLYYGTINSSGEVGSTGSTAIGATPTSPSIKVNPNNNKVYIASLTSTPSIYKSNTDYNSFSGSSSFSALSLGSLSGSVNNYDAFGIGPDGSLFLGGDDGSNTRYVQYSTDDGTNWSAGSGNSGIGGPNFQFVGSSSPYTIYYTKEYATYTNGSGFGSWSQIGNAGYETHPNDGFVLIDPNNSQILYMTTDQGLGASTNGGANIFEINDGIEAVQVDDFSMNSGKTIAWLASKAGIRKVTDYSTAPVWTNAMFPNGDGSPYYSAEMENDNDATAYVGNLRVYKTINSGTNWSQVLSGEDKGYPSVGTVVQAIEVCPTNSSLVLAGFYVEGSTIGGLWYSTDAGSTWNQLQLKSGTTLPNDVDVYDIEFTTEGGNPVAYIGVEYNSTTSARSVYRAEYNSGWTTRQDFDGSYTAVGYPISATIIDITVAGNYIYVCGTDVDSNHPIVYYRDHTADYTTSAGKWTTVTTSGFPTSQVGSAVAVGGGVVNCAVSNVIYTILESGGSSWSVGYTYPAGTEINVLFYDDLLAGTSTGLYGHDYDEALPVELTYFTATVSGDEILLNWETSTEVNNYGFDVERTVDLLNAGMDGWNNIGFVQGHGTSYSPKNYEFTDNSPPAGNLKYRLKQIDLDGGYEYYGTVAGVTFGITGNNEEQIPTEFALYQNYPNPFNPSTIISFTLPIASNVTLKIFNPLGKEVAKLIDNEFKEAGRYNCQYSTGKTQLSSGVYFYQLQAGEFSQTRKLILVK